MNRKCDLSNVWTYCTDSPASSRPSTHCTAGHAHSLCPIIAFSDPGWEFDFAEAESLEQVYAQESCRNRETTELHELRLLHFTAMSMKCV